MKKNYFLSLLLCTSIMCAQVTQLKDINDGSSGSNPSELIIFNGNMYFAADDGSGLNSGGTDYGKELWVSNVTVAGTNLVKGIKTGDSGSSPRAFFIFNDKLYFSANDDIDANLWATDGTSAGTVSAEIYPGINESVQRPIELDGKVYMTGISTNGDTNDLLIFDGTSEAVNANTTTNDESILSTMAALNGKLLMYANYAPDDATIDNELYEFNPGTGVFTLIKDIDPGTANSSISNLTTIGIKVYYGKQMEQKWAL
jgi:ELWxxDGT repeat protein